MLYDKLLVAESKLRRRRHRRYLFCLLVVFLSVATAPLYAQNSPRGLRIEYNGKLCDIAANDTDLANALSILGERTNVYVWYPRTLKKKITLNIADVSIKEAFKRLLRDFDHLIVYKGASKNRAAVSQVFVLGKNRKNGNTTVSKSGQSAPNKNRVIDRIRSYQHRIDSIKSRLANIDENSRRGRSYLRQIRRFEDRIRKLEGQVQ